MYPFTRGLPDPVRPVESHPPPEQDKREVVVNASILSFYVRSIVSVQTTLTLTCLEHHRRREHENKESYCRIVEWLQIQ